MTKAVGLGSALTFTESGIQHTWPRIPAPASHLAPCPSLTLSCSLSSPSPAFAHRFPLTFTPEACLLVPVSEFSKATQDKSEGGGGKAAKEGIRGELTQTRKKEGRSEGWGAVGSEFELLPLFRVCFLLKNKVK